MGKHEVVLLLVCAGLLGAMLSCKGGDEIESPEDAQVAGTVDITKAAATVKSVLAANLADHEAPADYVWDNSQVIPVVLDGSTITASSGNVTVNGSTATITASGTYSLSGSLADGQILVNAGDDGTVRLILNGVTLGNSTTSPLCVAKAKKVIIVLADNTQNSVTDASSYVFPSTDVDEPNAAVFSSTDLTICGNGALTVNGNYNDGIASKDGLIIKSGTIAVTSVDDGIRGKDYIVIKDGTINVISTGDGLKADNDEDATRGYISVESGTIHVTSGMDGLTAETDVVIANGIIVLTTGGGSSRTVSSTVSAKGIKGLVCVVIGDGTFTISSADDAVHSNATIVINGGTFALSSGDDGVHADSLLAVNAGAIAISKCYEGLESCTLVINDGNIRVTSSDDGINAAGGRDGSGAGGWAGGMPATGNYFLYMNGGYVAVTATGDGIDINGSIVMKGGTVLVNGPTSSGNGAIDYDASFTMTGGFIVAAGSSGMAQGPSTTSTQYSVMINFSSAKAAGTLFHIQASDGSDIVTFKPAKAYQSVLVGSPKLLKGSAYDIYLGGSSTGTATDGLYEGGTNSGGTLSRNFTITSVLTKISG